MSNELTDVRCSCGDEYPADSYDAGFIAGSGMCQNCDAALPPKDICTCPSGDGSLRHPCPAHPAVEQAGGDERAAFFKHLIGRHPAHETEIVRVVEHNYAAWKAWQARAALAQPSPVPEEEKPGDRILCYGCFAEGVGPEHFDEAGKCLVRQQLDPLNLALHAKAFNEAPAEALKPEQAEAERPIVSFEKYMQVMYDRDENAKRLDAALARVAELERQGLVDAPGPDEIHQMAFEEGQPAEDGDGYLFSAEEFDLFVQRLLDSCAAPVAQAQHSVPEEFSFEYRHPNGECHTVTVSREQVINEMPDFLFEALCSKFCNCEAVGETNVVECRCDEYAEEFKLIAAAPGKEGV